MCPNISVANDPELSSDKYKCKKKAFGVNKFIIQKKQSLLEVKLELCNSIK